MAKGKENAILTTIRVNSKEAVKNINAATNAVTDYAKSLKNIPSLAKSAFNATAIVGLVKGVISLTNAMINASKKQTDYIENLNLMDTAYGKVNNSGRQLIDTMSETIGLDQSGLTKTLGTYRQISSALGLANKEADKFSENLLKMTQDVSSLYNLTFEEASSKMISAITGQSRAVKVLGADITEAGLQQTALNLGIETSVSDMTQAEKAILRYITLSRQLANAQGDTAKTINEVANQTKIFKEQLAVAARQIGGIFIPVLKAILPVLNGILMAFNTVVGTILGFFGIDAKTIAADFGKSIGDISIGFDDIGTSAGKASKAAKEALKELRGFDKLNVIKTPESAGSVGSRGGVGGGVGGGIDKGLLDALDQTDWSLGNISQKAQDIRDKILKLLGFHKELNKETGEWEWKYGGLKTTIKNLWNKFKDLNTDAKIFVGLITGLIASKVLTGLGNLVKIFGKTKLGKVISDLLRPTKELGKYIVENVVAGFKGLKNLSFGEVIDTWSGTLTTLDKVKTTLVGAAGIYAGTLLVKDGFKDLAETGEMTGGDIAKVIGGVATDAGSLALTLGAWFGKEGAVVGAILGGIAGIMTAYDEYKTATETNMQDIKENGEEIAKMYENWQDLQEETNDMYSQSSSATTYYKSLRDELDSIVDKNGKIKKGYEDRAETITGILNNALGTEITIVDGVIQKWGEYRNELDKVIARKKVQVELDNLEKLATEAIDNKKKATEKLAEATHNQEVAEENLKKKVEEIAHWFGISADEIYRYYTTGELSDEFVKNFDGNIKELTDDLEDNRWRIDRQSEALEKARTNTENAALQVDEYSRAIDDWEKMSEYVYTEQYDQADLYYNHIRNLREGDLEQNTDYWEGVRNQHDKNLEALEKNREVMDERTYNQLKKEYEDELRLANDHLFDLEEMQVDSAEDVNDRVVELYRQTGEESLDKAIGYLKQLPEEVQTEIIDKMKQKGYDMADQLQQGLDSVDVNKTVNINGNTEGLKSAFNSFVNSPTAKSLANALGIKFPQFAIGGFPTEGELFIAREQGPEMVGSINGRTAVANNDQIVESISIGVARAMAGANRKTDVTIVAEGDTKGLMDFINFKQRENDRQYGL